jgi:hypothetical protein
MSEENKDRLGEKIEDKEIPVDIPGGGDEPEPARNRVPRGLIVLLVLALAGALYYFLIYKRSQRTEKAAELPVAAVQEKEAPLPTPSAEPQTPPVELNKSDDFVRQLAKQISSHPRIASWLQSRDLIRRFVAAVDNIANGLSPRAHIDFFHPPGEFEVVKKGDILIADPKGYGRYDTVTDVFVSLDIPQCVSLFRALKPLCQEAYRDLGYPGEDFEQTFLRAIIELLDTPVVEGDIVVEKSVFDYVMLDPELESLSDAKKHLLRMGPDNVGAIQAKMREIAIALGFPESRLPQPRTYTPAGPSS